jgi:hypothetical protein
MRIRMNSRALVAAIIVASTSLSISQALATTVVPVVLDGNPKCGWAEIGLLTLTKFDPPAEGINGPQDNVTMVVNGTSISWTSTVGIDAVIVKAGSNANVYFYDEAMADTDLVTPTNPSNQKPYGLSHVEFCVDVEDEEESPDSATVGVALGTCEVEGDSSQTDVIVTITGDGSATVVVRDDQNNLVETFHQSGSVELPPGTYHFDATPGDNTVFTEGSDETGELVVEDCTPEVKGNDDETDSSGDTDVLGTRFHRGLSKTGSDAALWLIMALLLMATGAVMRVVTVLVGPRGRTVPRG